MSSLLWRVCLGLIFIGNVVSGEGLFPGRDRFSLPGGAKIAGAGWRAPPDFDPPHPFNSPRLDNRPSSFGLEDTMMSGPRGRCDKRIRVINGATRVRDRGTLARFQCSYGYHMMGASVAVCVKGKWSDPPPICVRDGCGKLPIPIHGTLRLLYGGGVGIFSCLYGYKMEGDRMLTCDGQRWNGTAPLCIEIPPIVVTPFPITFPSIPADLDIPQQSTPTIIPAAPNTGGTETTVSETPTSEENAESTTVSDDATLTSKTPQPITIPNLEGGQETGGFATETSFHLETGPASTTLSTIPGNPISATNGSLDEYENSITTPVLVTAQDDVGSDITERHNDLMELTTTRENLESGVSPDGPVVTSETPPATTIASADVFQEEISTASTISPNARVTTSSLGDQDPREVGATIEDTKIPSVSEPTQILLTEDSYQAANTTLPTTTSSNSTEVELATPSVTQSEKSSDSIESDIVSVPPEPEVEEPTSPPPDSKSAIIYDITTLRTPIQTVRTTDATEPQPETASTKFQQEFELSHDKIREYVAISPSKLDVDASPSHLAVGQLLVIAGSALVIIGFISTVAGLLMYCWRKNKGIARPRRNDVDGRTLSFHEGIDELIWFDPRDNTRL